MKMLGITWRDREKGKWTREQTKVEDILNTIKMGKWSWAVNIMGRTDNRWTKRAIHWQPRNCKRSQGRQRVRWMDEITAFAGAGCSTLTSDREVEEVGKGLCATVNYTWLITMMMIRGDYGRGG